MVCVWNLKNLYSKSYSDGALDPHILLYKGCNVWLWYGKIFISFHSLSMVVWKKIFFFDITSVFVLDPLVLKAYLTRKLSKFRMSREVGGPNFGLWLEKTFWGVMACRFAWCNRNSHLLRSQAITLEVESKCASVCFVLLIGFLKNDWI